MAAYGARPLFVDGCIASEDHRALVSGLPAEVFQKFQEKCNSTNTAVRGWLGAAVSAAAERVQKQARHASPAPSNFEAAPQTMRVDAPVDISALCLQLGTQPLFEFYHQRADNMTKAVSSRAADDVMHLPLQNALFGYSHDGGQSIGDARLAAIRSDFYAIFDPHPGQIHAFEVMLYINRMTIYYEEWDRDHKAICKRNGWNNPLLDKSGAILIWPRRRGKTTAAAVGELCIAMNCPHWTGATISVNYPTACICVDEMRTRALSYRRFLRDFVHRPSTSASGSLRFWPRGSPTDVRSSFALPQEVSAGWAEGRAASRGWGGLWSLQVRISKKRCLKCAASTVSNASKVRYCVCETCIVDVSRVEYRRDYVMYAPRCREYVGICGDCVQLVVRKHGLVVSGAEQALQHIDNIMLGPVFEAYGSCTHPWVACDQRVHVANVAERGDPDEGTYTPTRGFGQRHPAIVQAAHSLEPMLHFPLPVKTVHNQDARLSRRLDALYQNIVVGGRQADAIVAVDYVDTILPAVRVDRCGNSDMRLSIETEYVCALWALGVHIHREHLKYIFREVEVVVRQDPMEARTADPHGRVGIIVHFTAIDLRQDLDSVGAPVRRLLLSSRHVERIEPTSQRIHEPNQRVGRRCQRVGRRCSRPMAVWRAERRWRVRERPRRM